MTTEGPDPVNVAAFFDRIGYRGPAEPTVDTVHELVAAHNGSIPFENLDPLVGIPVADLGAAALSDKFGAPPSRWLLLWAQRTDGVCARGVGLWRRTTRRPGGVDES